MQRKPSFLFFGLEGIRTELHAKGPRRAPFPLAKKEPPG